MCVLLVLVAGGLAIWALGLQSDLDDQRDQTAQAQQQAEQASQEVESLSGQIDEISQAVSDAGSQLSQAGADAQETAQTTLDGLGAKLESVKGQVEKAIAAAGGAEQDTAPNDAATATYAHGPTAHSTASTRTGSFRGTRGVPIMVLIVLVLAIVLDLSAIDTARNAPETFTAMLVLVALAVVLDVVWKRVRPGVEV